MRLDFIGVLKTLHALGLGRTQKVSVGGIQVSPRDVVAACLPDSATIGPRMTGKTCAGLWVTGKGKDGEPRPARWLRLGVGDGGSLSGNRSELCRIAAARQIPRWVDADPRDGPQPQIGSPA